MNINQIKWCSYTEENPDYVQEIEFLEWQSDPEGKFCKSDVCKLFQSITFAYSKVLEYPLLITMLVVSSSKFSIKASLNEPR